MDRFTLYGDNQIENILKIAYQILSALDHINSHGFTCHNLDPATILLDNNYSIKLYNYGLYYMTNNGKYVSFPIGNVKYLPPEALAGSMENPKSDIWSLGIIILELLWHCRIWSSFKTSQTVRKVLSLCNTQNVLEKLAREHNCLENYQNMDDRLKDLIEQCLSISLFKRPTPKELLENRIFDEIRMTEIEKDEAPERSFVEKYCTLDEIYYLWQVAGGDVHQELKKEGLIKSEAPILSIPK